MTMPNTAYCIARSGDIPRLNSWFDKCKQTQRPYVVIHPGKKYAWVEIDLIGQSYDLHPIAALEISNLLLSHAVYKNGGLACITDGTYPATFLAAKVPREHAETIAQKMVKIASNPKFQVNHEASYRWRPPLEKEEAP